MSDTKDLVQQLRVHEWSGAEEAADTIERLTAERDALRARHASIEDWIAHGEKEFSDRRNPGMFKLGKWWGERPWLYRDGEWSKT